jgi:hypothetical protein
MLDKRVKSRAAEALCAFGPDGGCLQAGFIDLAQIIACEGYFLPSNAVPLSPVIVNTMSALARLVAGNDTAEIAQAAIKTVIFLRVNFMFLILLCLRLLAYTFVSTRHGCNQG